MTIPKQSREVLICVAGLALLGGALGARRYLRPTGVGSVTLEHGIHNFGDVGQGETLAHTFRLTNGWAEPIEIVQAQSSCSCTAAVDLVGRVVAPKAGLDIPLTLKTGSDDGPRTGTVTLYYRSVGATTPPLNYAEVRVAANVVPDYRVRPNLVDFGTVDHTGAITKVIRLRPERLPGVKIIRLDTSSDAFKARRVAAPVGSTDIHIELTFSGRSLWKSGPLNATLFIDTDSRGAATAQVLARVRYRAPVEVEPAAIVIGTGTKGPVGREILISAARPVRIAGVRCSSPLIKIAPHDTTASSTHRLALTIGDARGVPIDSEVIVDLEPAGATEARAVAIPVHRLGTQTKE